MPTNDPGNIGDVEYTAARLITLGPDGVGPTTIAVLLAQAVQAAESASAGQPHHII
jgi:methylenetetrahydrofolate dehydrogenase (NADP+) / methenyltetrahydrofolate cyclohydrolase